MDLTQNFNVKSAWDVSDPKVFAEMQSMVQLLVSQGGQLVQQTSAQQAQTQAVQATQA